MRLVLLAILFSASWAQAQEDDDDPKSRPSISRPAPERPSVKSEARPEPIKSDKAAKSDTPKAEPPKPEAARPESPKARPAAPKPEAKPEVRVADPPRAAVGKLTAPRVAETPPPSLPPVEAATTPVVGGRSVRVRLLDGSQVTGTVRAELSETLVVDCNLGLLSIPRARISVIAYDAGPNSKKAPVQQRDDELPAAKKR
jgi:hypothetical protein